MCKRFAVVFTVLVFVSLAPRAQADFDIEGRKLSEWQRQAREGDTPKKREIAVIHIGLGLGFSPTATDRSSIVTTLNDVLSKETEPRVRNRTLTVCKALKIEELNLLIPVLAEKFAKDADLEIRKLAGECLVVAGNNTKTVTKDLLPMFKDADPGIKTLTVEIFGKMGADGKTAIPHLSSMFKEKDVNLRIATLSAIRQIGNEALDLIPEVTELLAKDESENVRKEAARVLGSFSILAKSAIPGLAKAMREDAKEDVRLQALLALEKMGEAARPVIKDIFETAKTDKSDSIRGAAVRTICIVSSPPKDAFVKELAEMIATEKIGDVRILIIQELAEKGTDAKAALPYLDKVSTDVSVPVRNAARAAIDRINGKEKPKEKDGK